MTTEPLKKKCPKGGTPPPAVDRQIHFQWRQELTKLCLTWTWPPTPITFPLLVSTEITNATPSLPCPLHFSWQITNADFSDREAVQWLADAWHKTAACKTLNERLASETPLPLLARPKRGCLSNLRQLRALMMRASMNSSRDPAAYAFRCDQGYHGGGRFRRLWLQWLKVSRASDPSVPDSFYDSPSQNPRFSVMNV